MDQVKRSSSERLVREEPIIQTKRSNSERLVREEPMIQTKWSNSEPMHQGKRSNSGSLEPMDEVEKSELEKRLNKIKGIFDRNYQKKFYDKPSGSFRGSGSRNDDSSATGASGNISQGGRPKTNRVETNSELPGQPIRGFTNEILFLKNFLLKQKDSEEFKMVAIVGKYGVGKTALCQVVFNDEDLKGVYFPRLWVSMYSHAAKEDEDQKMAVVKRILIALGVEDNMIEDFKAKVKDAKKTKEEVTGVTEEGNELSTLLYLLNSNLIGKKYMIVLDGVWEDNKWDQKLDDEKYNHEKSHLSCGFPKGFGGRVIVTSRDESMAKKIVGEEENVMRLFPRSDASKVYDIYKDAAKAVGIDMVPRYPGRFRQELMDKSCGVPLAARLLAKIEPQKVDEGGEMDKK